jgi:hypothetical protein
MKQKDRKFKVAWESLQKKGIEETETEAEG